jgi:hypothetical protein
VFYGFISTFKKIDLCNMLVGSVVKNNLFLLLINVITYSNICSQGKRKAAKTTPPPDSEAQAAYMDMVREQKRYNRLQAEAKIAEAWEAGMYWRFLREAKQAELLAKGLPVPDMNTISVSDSPFNSGA